MFTAEKAGIEIPEAAPEEEVENGNAHEGPATEEAGEPIAMDAEGLEET